jgi:cytochrome c oxidase subunit 4
MANHVVIPKIYYQGTFVALIILTVITVAVSRIDLGVLHTPVAILIALIKAGLVGAFFMGLRWERANLIFVFGAVMAIVLFFLFTFIDIEGRGAITDIVERPYNYKSPVTVTPMDSSGAPH